MKENFNNSEANFAPETMNAYEASTSTNATSIDLQDEDYNLCSAIVEQKIQFDNNNNEQVGDEEKKAEYLAHKEFYNNVTKYANGFQRLEGKAITKEVIGGAYAYLVLTRGINEKTVKEFYLNNYSLNTATDC